MSKVDIVRKEGGRPFKDKRGRYVFHKEGVYFALSDEQMTQMRQLIDNIQTASQSNDAKQ